MTTNNWIERRARRERTLREGAAGVWVGVVAAIDDCCKSFDSQYSRAASMTVHNQRQDRLLVEVNLPQPIPVGTRRVLSIEFDGEKIHVQLGQESPKTFEINADETHAYIEHEGREISVDEFSQIALEKALFAAPNPRPGSAEAFPSPAGKDSWMS